jgi:hypothetical protein
MEIFNLRIPDDEFKGERQKLVISALGELAQQEIQEAEQELAELAHTGNTSLRGQALSELCVAYWHRPADVPSEILERVGALGLHASAEVRTAAIASLSSLAQLGCEAARICLENLSGK